MHVAKQCFALLQKKVVLKEYRGVRQASDCCQCETPNVFFKFFLIVISSPLPSSCYC
uniref:Uncharacterized protein n=1 Tax=Anguilla anguilla TaxID=7936 RepID=A0A0E9T6E7_ANGAN